jgi:hypothetical protein
VSLVKQGMSWWNNFSRAEILLILILFVALVNLILCIVPLAIPALHQQLWHCSGNGDGSSSCSSIALDMFGAVSVGACAGSFCTSAKQVSLVTCPNANVQGTVTLSNSTDGDSLQIGIDLQTGFIQQVTIGVAHHSCQFPPLSNSGYFTENVLTTVGCPLPQIRGYCIDLEQLNLDEHDDLAVAVQVGCATGNCPGGSTPAALTARLLSSNAFSIDTCFAAVQYDKVSCS